MPELRAVASRVSVVPGSETTCVRCGARVVLYMKIQGGKYVLAGNPKAYEWHCGTDPRYPTRGHSPKNLPGEDRTMHFRIIIEGDAERSEGKFASRDDIIQQIVEELEGADPGEVEGENGGTYEITEWNVTEDEVKPPAKAAKTAGGRK